MNLSYSNSSSESPMCRFDPTTTFHKVYHMVFRLTAPIEPLSTFFAVPANVLLIVAVHRQKAWPAHLRLLLINMSIACILLSTSFVHHFTSSNLSLMISLTPKPITAVNCVIRESFYSIAALVTVLSLGSVPTERFLVTKGYLVQIKSQDRYVLCMLGISWIGAVFTTGLIITRAMIFMPDTVICSCFLALAMPKRSAFAIYPLYIAIELSLCATTFYILNVNKKRFAEFAEITGSAQSLNERHKLRENIRISEMLVPSVMAHAVCAIIGIGGPFLTLLFSSNTFTEIQLAVLLQAHMTVSLYSLAHPCALFWKSASLRRKIFKNNKVVAVQQVTDGKLWTNRQSGSAAAYHHDEADAAVLDFRISSQVHNQIVNSFWTKKK